MNGFIKLHRSLINWEWFNDNNTLKVWLVCLMKANFKPTKYRGQIINEGQFITTTKELSELANLTIKQTYLALEKLESTNNIARKKEHNKSLITVIKWLDYQVQDESEGTRREHEGNTKGTHLIEEERKERKEYLNLNKSIKTNKRNKYIYDELPTYDNQTNPPVNEKRLKELLNGRMSKK